MLRNMGSTDRLLRAVLVAPLLVIAAVGSCPPYRPINIDTRKRVRTN